MIGALPGHAHLPLLWATLLTCSVAVAADQKEPSSGGIYKCHTRAGVTAFVSKLDPSLTDCVRIADTPSGNPEPAPGPGAVAPQGVSQKPESTLHPEAQDDHDARMKQMFVQVTQWCADNNQKPNQKPKEREKDNASCVMDKMGTYNLLHP